VDGDGHPDILVSACVASGSEESDGRIYLYRGDGRTLRATPDWTADGGQKGCRFGRSMHHWATLIATGFADFAVGAPLFQSAKKGGGRVDVFYAVRMATVAVTYSRWMAQISILRRPSLVVKQSSNFTSDIEPGEVSPPNNENSRNSAGFPSALRAWCSPRSQTLLVMAAAFFFWRVRIRARADERQRLARDLHDDLGAALTRSRRSPNWSAVTAHRLSRDESTRRFWLNPRNKSWGRWSSHLVGESGQ